jgi:hypothetical protein
MMELREYTGKIEPKSDGPLLGMKTHKKITKLPHKVSEET